MKQNELLSKWDPTYDVKWSRNEKEGDDHILSCVQFQRERER